jgi:hypothetical protein
MSNPEKPSHWKSLAELLGAQVTESEPAPPRPQITQPTASSPPRELKQSRPAPAKPPKSDWRSLAGALGLAESQVSPAESPPREDPTAFAASSAVMNAGQGGMAESFPVRESVPARETPSDSDRQHFASDAAPSEPRDLAAAHWGAPAEPADEPIDPLEMPATEFVEEVADAIELEVDDEGHVESDAVAEERRRRRRRRRRRGRRSEGPVEEGPRSAESSGEEAEPEPVGEFIDDAIPVDSPPAHERDMRSADAIDAAPERESDDGRPRRRRRRRRRGRRDEAAGPREKSSEAAPVAEDSAEDDDVLAQVLADADDELEGDEKGGEAHLSHKKIPSWQEAIDVVVASNLAQRARHPGAGPRGRGRRDR